MAILASLLTLFGLLVFVGDRASERWRAVRMEDARARMRVADIEAERHRAPLEETIAARVSAAVETALRAHAAEIKALEQDVADARSRMEMGRRPR